MRMWKNKLILRDISLAGMFMGLINILNIIFYFFPVVMGYSIYFYFIVFSIGLVVIKTNIVKASFFIMTPIVLLIVPNVYWINLGQILVEYFLAIWCFFPFLFGSKIIEKLNAKKYGDRIQLLVFSTLFILCWLLKLFLHVLAGYLWWTNHDWWGSMLINFPIMFTNILFTIPIFVLLFNRTINLTKTYYLNIWNEVKV